MVTTGMPGAAGGERGRGPGGEGLRRRDLVAPVAAVAVALVVLVLCRLTLLPGVGFWDTAEFQTVGPVLGTAHPTGFPAYVLLGWLASVVLQPFGDPAFRMNLLSALLIAAAAGLTVLLGRRLTGSVAIGAAVGLAVGTNEVAWRIGTHADPHAFHLALVAALLLALVAWGRDRAAGRGDRWLVAASAIFGVSVANHSLTLLLAIPVGLYVLAVDPGLWRRGRLVALCAAVLVGVAALLYLELPLRSGPFRAPLVYGEPHTWEGFRYIVLAEQFRGSIVDPFGGWLPGPEGSPKVDELVELTVRHFGPLAALVPVGFLATLVREPRYALLSGLSLAVTMFFSLAYVNADITRYYLGPILIAWTWLAILGAAVRDLLTAAVGSADPDRDPAVEPGGGNGRPSPAGTGTARPRGSAASAPALAAIAVAAALLIPTLGELERRYARVDVSDETGAQRWLDATIAQLPPDAVVVSWWSYSTPLWYAQHVEGRIPGVLIADDRTRLDQRLGEVEQVIERFVGERPVYLLRADGRELERIGQRWALDPGPNPNSLVRVVGPVAATR